MCFSASASLTASILLIPTGIYCLKQANENAKDYLPVAAWPLFFGVQQVFEGVIWLKINSNQPNDIHYAALSFLFFSHFFWLFWMPLSAFYLETRQLPKNLLLSFTIIGFLYGIMLYIPLVLNDDLWAIAVQQGSINYTTHFIFTDLFPKNFNFVTYVIIILSSSMISTNRSFKFLGQLILLSLIVTYIAFIHAFISIWCFFAAILSLFVLRAVNKVTQLRQYTN
jgi:hypothetical protein